MRTLLLLLMFRFAVAEAVVDGGFDQDTSWRLWGGEIIAIQAEDGQRFLRLSTSWPGQRGVASQEIVLDPAWVGVVISARFRARDLVLGPEVESCPRVGAIFYDETGNQVGGWPLGLPQIRTSGGWQTYATAVRVPNGAVRLYLEVSNWYSRGTTDIDDVSVIGHSVPLVKLPDPPLPLNGDFELVEAGRPSGWLPSDPRAIAAGEGFAGMGVRLVNHRVGGSVDISRVVPLDPAWKEVTVEARMRLADLQPGTEVWHTARLAWCFIDAYNAVVGPSPTIPRLANNSDWIVLSATGSVPAGAVAVKVSPDLQAACGRLDVDDVRLIGR